MLYKKGWFFIGFLSKKMLNLEKQINENSNRPMASLS